MSIFKKETPPNICELTPLSVNFQKQNATKNLLEKPFSIVFARECLKKHAAKHLRVDTLKCQFSKNKRNQKFVRKTISNSFLQGNV